MKPLSHWIELQGEIEAELRVLRNKPEHYRELPRPPEKRGSMASWGKAYQRWKRDERAIYDHRRRVAKAEKRLAYVLERIEALSPKTFWEML